jgi:hypothetical protein
MAGMAVYGLLSGMLPASGGYAVLLAAYPTLEYPVMFAFMTPPMVALPTAVSIKVDPNAIMEA